MIKLVTFLTCFFCSVVGQYEGEIRLVGGHADWTGKLEIYHANSWGDVCDDSFGLEEAMVVCRQLNFPTASPKFDCCGPTNRHIWLDDLGCVGTESTLASCNHPDWGVENCGNTESISVTCSANPCHNVTCQNGGSCVKVDELTFRCDCDHGYSGTMCENDVDECAVMNGGCSHTCTNLLGSFTCSCPDTELSLGRDNLTCYAPGISVFCDSHNMEVWFAKDHFPGLHASYISLKTPPCSANDNSTHIKIDVPLKGCGTDVQETSNRFWYHNEISGRQIVLNGLVTRVRDLNVTVRCQYPKTILAENFYLVNTGELHFKDHAQGTYQVSMDLIHNGQTYQSSNANPLKVEPGEKLSIKMTLNSNDSHLQVFARNCKATPTPHDEGTQYLILDNGCAHDTTLTINNMTNITQETISLETFKFVGNESRVYIHCEVLVCNVSDPNSRCRQGCLSASRPTRQESTYLSSASRPTRQESTYLSSASRLTRQESTYLSSASRQTRQESTYLSAETLSVGPVQIADSYSSRAARMVQPTNVNDVSNRNTMIAGLALLGVALVMTTVAITIIAKNAKEEHEEKEMHIHNK